MSTDFISDKDWGTLIFRELTDTDTIVASSELK